MGTCTFNKWLVAAVSLFTLLPVSAFASDASGRFTLKHEVHWANVTLPAGDYTFALEQRGMPVLHLRAVGGEPAFLVLAKTVESVTTETDSLVLQQQGGEWFVSEMIVGAVGEEFSFAMPDANAVSARKKSSVNDKVASLSQP